MEKYIGTLLGGCCGDILGSQTEGMTREQILKKYGWQELNMPARKEYTDDTEMTLILASHLVKNNGEIFCTQLHIEYGENMTNKGYSQKTREILTLFKNKKTNVERGFSPNNGAVMRIAPLALIKHKNDKELVKDIENATFYTHGGSPDAVASAYIHCKLIRALIENKFEYSPNQQNIFFTERVFQYILKLAKQHPPLFAKLNLVYHCFNSNYNITEELSGNPNFFQITAIDCLSCTIYAFLNFFNRPREAVNFAASMGGDTDTIAKLVGDLCGALHGTSWIPREWRDVENEKTLIELGKSLFEIDSKRC